MEMNAANNRQPKDNDPQEIAIRQKLEDSILTTDFSKNYIKQSTELLQTFFDDPTNQKYHEVLKSLSTMANTKIISGVENIQNVTKEKGAIIITNHLGIIKLTKINDFEPFPLRHASLLTIAEKLNMELHESAIELPNKLQVVQKNCGVLVVSAGGENRTQKLINDCRELIDHERSAIIMYPEGGTSGKRNNGGPYDLDKFHSGAFVVAQNLGIPILPVCQYFNPASGFELSILEPILLDQQNPIDLKVIAENTRLKMQSVFKSSK